jgi:hypothetical protein
MNEYDADLLERINSRCNSIADLWAELSVDLYRPPSDRSIIHDFGFALYEEFASHRDGDPQISSYYRDIWGRAPLGRAESMRRSRGLRWLEKAGLVELFASSCGTGSKQVRWIMVLPNSAKTVRS